MSRYRSKRRRYKKVITRNADAQRFLDKVKLRKEQEAELDEMDASFDRRDLDAEFLFATKGL